MTSSVIPKSFPPPSPPFASKTRKIPHQSDYQIPLQEKSPRNPHSPAEWSDDSSPKKHRYSLPFFCEIFSFFRIEVPVPKFIRNNPSNSRLITFSLYHHSCVGWFPFPPPVIPSSPTLGNVSPPLSRGSLEKSQLPGPVSSVSTLLFSSQCQSHRRHPDATAPQRPFFDGNRILCGT